MSAGVAARVARSASRLALPSRWLCFVGHVRPWIHWRSFAASNVDLPPHVKIRMPALSPTMKQGNLVNWVKKEGETVSPGDVLAEIETDKATVEFESQDDGVLAKILVPAGAQDVPVGALIALLAEEESDVPKLREARIEPEDREGGAAAEKPTPTTSAGHRAEPPPQSSSITPSSPASSAGSASGLEAQRSAPATATARATPGVARASAMDPRTNRILASPYARKIAMERGIDMTGVQGTGPHGRIVAADLEAALELASHQAIQQLPLELFIQSKRSIPHYQLVTEIQLDKVHIWLSSLEGRHERSKEEPIELEDVLIKALAVAARQVPQVNASFLGTSIREYADVDVLVLPSDPRTPYRVVPGAHAIGLRQIHHVRTGQQESGESKNASDSFGTIGFAWNQHVLQEMAIIVPPHAAMIVVGKPEQRIIPRSDGAFQLGTFALATASFDHRVVDGAVGAQFMARFQQCLQDPLSMLE